MVQLLPLAGLLLVAAACVSAQSTPWTDLRVTFAGSEAGGFHQLPRTKVDALAQAWTQPPEVSNTKYDIMCPEKDPSVCVVLSKATGNVNGIEIAFLVSDTAGPLIYADHPMYVRQKRFGYDVYVTTVYTVKPGTAQKPHAAGAKLETGNGAWLETGPKGVPLFEIPRLEANMGNTLYTKENCVPGMGTHYYYNISPNLDCMDLEPQFGLYKKGELIGFGIQSWGSPTQIASTKWFEPVPALAVRPTIPNCPQCMVDWARDYHILSLHVYFVDQPWNIKCN